MCDKKIKQEIVTGNIIERLSQGYSHPFVPVDYYIDSYSNDLMDSPEIQLMGQDGDVWRCPIDYSNSNEHCPIHCDDFDRDDIKDFLQEEIYKKSDRPLEIVGAELPGIQIEQNKITRPVRFINCHINGGVSIKSVSCADLLISGCNIEGVVSIADCDVDGCINMSGNRFEDQFSLEGQISADKVKLLDCYFDKFVAGSRLKIDGRFDARFSIFNSFIGDYIEFTNDVRFRSSEFRNKVTFNHTIIRKYADFQNAVFESEVNFRSMKYRWSSKFDGAVFKESVDFGRCIFDRKQNLVASLSKM